MLWFDWVSGKMEDNQAKCEGAGRSRCVRVLPRIIRGLSEIADRTIIYVGKDYENEAVHAMLAVLTDNSVTSSISSLFLERPIRKLQTIWEYRVGR